MTEAFEHIRTQRVPTLNLDVEEYRPRETQARHFIYARTTTTTPFWWPSSLCPKTTPAWPISWSTPVCVVPSGFPCATPSS